MALFAFLCFFYGSVSWLFLYHNDIGWHLATGDLILDTHTLPITDPWSYASGGAPWYNMAWLWEILASVIFKYMGGLGLLLLTLFIGVATLCLLATLAIRIGAHPTVTVGVAALIGAVFPFYEPPDIFLCAAPQQMTLLFLALLLMLLWYFQADRRRGYYLGIPFIFMLWCNMHGGFILGLAIIGAFALAALLKHDAALAGRAMILLLLSASAVLINPYGIHIVDGVRGTLGHMYQNSVSEWQPLYKGGINLAYLAPSLIYILLFLLALGPCRRWKNQSPFTTALAAISVILLIKGILVLRYFSLFLLVSLPVTTLGLSSLWETFSAEKKCSAHPSLCPCPLPVFLIIGMLTIGIVRTINPEPIDMPQSRDPKSEIQFITQHYPDARIFNHWNYGSFIIFEGHGKLRHFIDGRMGTAYPDSVFADFMQLYATKDWKKIIRKYQIDLIIWPYKDRDMLAWFDHNPRWKRAFTGDLAVVWVKR